MLQNFVNVITRLSSESFRMKLSILKYHLRYKEDLLHHAVLLCVEAVHEPIVNVHGHHLVR